MSVQTSVIENGHWITRSLDEYRIRSQNALQEENQTTADAANLVNAPCLGVLTRTLCKSSVIKQIIPAQFRHRSRNDVILISEDRVEIREVSDDYTLENVITLDRFDSAIRAARIIRDRREPIRGQNATAGKYMHWDSSLYDRPPGPSQSDDGQSGADGRLLPPHILVLVLASNQITFTCMCDHGSHANQLIYGRHELPVARSSKEQLGTHLAVDPR